MRWQTIKKFLKKSSGLDRLLFAVILVGAVVCLISLFRGILLDSQVQVEYLENGEVTGSESSKYLVDIEGAVVSPGVYEFPAGSRIKDVLVMAGGLSEKADRDFCEKNINLAEEIKDGLKIYIPSAENADAEQGYVEASLSSKKININTATLAELHTLWGVGDARADSIVKNRPYKSIDDLITKGVLPKSIFEKNKELMSIY